VLHIKQSSIVLNRYYLLATLSLFFILFLSQKENFFVTVTGISITIISFFIILKVRNHRHNRHAVLHTLSAEKEFHVIEEDGAFAKFDKNYNITYVSKEFINILGVEDGNLLDMLKNCTKNPKILQKLEKSIKENKPFNDILELQLANQTMHIDTFVYKVGNQKLTKQEFIIRCNDITSYIATEEELKNQLFLDQYTKLPTRLQLLDDLDQQYKTKKTHAQTLFYIKIDAYEEINEFFGIDTGHKLLVEVAKWLQENVPTKKTQVYKFDHNNFAMYTSSRINLADLENYLRRLNTKIRKHTFNIQDTDHDISFTIGVARGKNNLLKNAYLALNEAQKTNKPYNIFNKKNLQEEKYLQNIQTNKDIKSALLEDRIVPFFQPILNIQTNEIEKFESLIRIQNEDNTHIRPADFLEIAKQSKLYPELTKAMVTASLKRLEFLQHPITLNISIDDILNSKVSSFIIRKLQNSPYANLITFEILETNEIQNYIKVANFIKKIKTFGCQVAIDDFGSGYSNFEQVLKLDIDYIKIDGSLIRNIDTNKENEIVTKTIIAFAKELGVKTIAEFVSSEAIFDKVKLMGIDYAQGYYIGKPAPMAAQA
jgi:diguanylate cyclase (GGDEF)-like protein